MTTPASAAVSVVVPCYNAERWIGAALESVLAQDRPAREVIVVDDGSTDRSAEIVRSGYPGVIFIQQENRGVATARNKGVARAQGDWIAFIDADDFWLPGKLGVQMQALEGNPDARWGYTAWHVWPSEEPNPTSELLHGLETQQEIERERSGPTGWIYPDLLLGCHVWTSTVVLHRSLLDEIGMFDSGLRIGEDYDLWLRASCVSPVVRVARPMALYRMHPASITKAAPSTNHQALVVSRAIARWGYCMPSGNCADKAEVDRALARTWCDYAGAHQAAGNLECARYGALMSLRARWQQLDGWKLLAKNAVYTLASGARRP